jgi:hypothetical protein
MRKALIDLSSKLVVQVEDVIFDVAPSNIWVDCPDNIESYRYTYENNQFNLVPEPPSIPHTAAENEELAKQKLQDSDWSILPDVNLQNKTEWETYRSVLRAIAINPQSGDVPWPTRPQKIWN